MSNESGFTCPYCAMHSTGHDFSDLHSGCTFTCKECQCESVIAPMTQHDYAAIAGIRDFAFAIREARETMAAMVECDPWIREQMSAGKGAATVCRLDAVRKALSLLKGNTCP